MATQKVIRGPVFLSTYPSFGRSLTTPLMRLRPLQGPTRHGPPTHDHAVTLDGYLAFGGPKGPPRARSPEQGFREPDRPVGPSRPQPPRRGPRCRRRRLSWSLLPLRRLSPGESTPPRLASPGTFRPQGFSPSRRLAPRLDVRPCFMPETPMGFRPSGVSPHRQVPMTRRLGIAFLTFLLRVNLSSTRGVRSCTPRRASQTFAVSKALLRR